MNGLFQTFNFCLDVQGRLRSLCQHVMSHVFAVGSYPAAFILRHYLIIFHDDEFLPEHLLPWIELAMLTTATKVSEASYLLNEFSLVQSEIGLSSER